jgi:hypothetical protein
MRQHDHAPTYTIQSNIDDIQILSTKPNWLDVSIIYP